MRSVPRRERHRRLRNAKDCACRYHSPTPQIFDRLELLDQQLNYALPVGIISQAIITTDNYLGYSLSHYLFSGKRTAAFCGEAIIFALIGDATNSSSNQQWRDLRGNLGILHCAEKNDLKMIFLHWILHLNDFRLNRFKSTFNHCPNS